MVPSPKRYYYSYVGYAILNTEWLKKHGYGWRAGRIEVYDIDTSPGYASWEYGITYKGDDYLLPDFVDELKSQELLSLEDILMLFKKEGNPITLWEQ